MEKSSKATMSVSQMAKILGLKKTDSYWLVHKDQFQTVTIAGQMRIVISSFEDWYANQDHYKKVDGQAPGMNLSPDSYSIQDLATELGITSKCVYDLLYRNKIETFTVRNQKRVRKDVFEKWYQTQKHYRNAIDRKRDYEAEKSSITLPEMGRLLCVKRDTAYHLVRNNPQLEVVEIAGHKRVTIRSFEKWYANQDHYKKFEDRSKSEQKRLVKKHKKDRLGKTLRTKIPEIDETKSWFTVKEASWTTGVSESTIMRMIQSGELAAKQVNRKWHVMKDDVRWFLIQQENNEDGGKN